MCQITLDICVLSSRELFFAQSQAQEGTLVSDDTCHAYLPNRRRESAVLLAQTVPRRLEKAKCSSFLDLLDQTNAFLSISKEKSARVAEDLVPAAAAQIARNFVMCSCFTLKCPDKACVFLPRSGVLPGSPFIVRVWVHTFKRPVLRLRTEDRKWNPNTSVLVVTSPAGVPVDVGTSVYADDVMRLYATM